MKPERFETGSSGFVWQNLMPDELFSRTQFHVYAAYHMQIGEEWAGNEFINHYNRLYYIKSGYGVLKLKDKELILKSGHLYLIPPYQLLSHHCVGKLDFIWTHFQAQVDAGLDLFMLYGEATEVDCSALDGVLDDFIELTELTKQRVPSALFKRNRILLSLLQPIMEKFEHTKKGFQSFKHQTLLRALAKINEDVANAPDVKAMAEMANVTPEHFSRKFKAVFNVSPKRYILQKRIALAKQKLLLADANIDQIAEQCGFCDIFYFSRLFKQETGMSPSLFRKKHEVTI